MSELCCWCCCWLLGGMRVLGVSGRSESLLGIVLRENRESRTACVLGAAVAVHTGRERNATSESTTAKRDRGQSSLLVCECGERKTHPSACKAGRSPLVRWGAALLACLHGLARSQTVPALLDSPPNASQDDSVQERARSWFQVLRLWCVCCVC